MIGRRTRVLALVTIASLTMTTVAFADGIQGDTDAVATSAPAANGLDANQTIGTTATYDYSAYIKETGNAGDDVFAALGDTVGASVAITQNSLGWSASVNTQFTGAGAFTAYDQNKAGLLSVTVPNSATAGDINHIKLVITATASNSQSMSPNTVTLNYNITATAPVGCTYTASFLAPLDTSTPANFVGNTFKRGRVLPVKAKVYCNGVEITPDNSSLIPWISVQGGTFVPPATDAVETFSDAGSSSGDTQNMRFQSDGAGSGFWLFNLDTASQKINSPYVAYVNIGGTNYVSTAGTKITSTFVSLNPTK